MAVEDYYTWVYLKEPGCWIHGNAKARIDMEKDQYVVSYRRVGSDGYFWDSVYLCPTLGAAKALAETAFIKTKKVAA